jgi:SAM-dependent methyltransferase
MTDDVNLPEKWDENYQRGEDGWDLGGPTPVFKRLAESGRFKPGFMLVPGAGRGHDAREFSRRGFKVTAVDFASHAVQEMRRLADPNAPIEILQQDIFTFPSEYNARFDYLLEYTCFCAIHPSRRGEYADVAARLLKPGGILIDLAYPLDNRKDGPPFGFTESELFELFQQRGFRLLSREKPHDSIPRRKGAEALFIFQNRS